MRNVFSIAILSGLVLGGCTTKFEVDSGGADTNVPDLTHDDSDGDGIADVHEGYADADGDGIPNSEDLDSDGDCIPDAVERGDVGRKGLPVDSDQDGVPDYLDTDSDNNGVFDSEEAFDCDSPFDTDGDGVADYADQDDDGDTISDVEEGHDDIDGDGIPSRLDDDSDGDCIPDAIEAGDDDLETAARDSDEDGVPDYHDTDSDDDGYLDSEEVVDCTEAGDMDSDGVADYVDEDIDGDGLTNEDEITVHETDPYERDSDGDGYTDGMEVFAGSKPLEEANIPKGVAIEMGPRERQETEGNYTLDLMRLDVFAIVDTAYSYSCYHPDIPTFINNLVNQLFVTFDDLAIGFGAYDDYVSSSGSSWTASGGRPFQINHLISTDESSIKSASSSLSMIYGGDGYGSAYEAAYQAITGVGFDDACNGSFDAPEDVLPFLSDGDDAFGGTGGESYDSSVVGVGENAGVGWRNGSSRIVLLAADNTIRDANDGHDMPTNTCYEPASYEATVEAALENDVKIVGINVYEYQYSDSTLQNQLEKFVGATESYIDQDGDGDEDDPAVLFGDWNWPDINDVVSAIWDLAEDQSMDISFAILDDDNGWITGIGPTVDFPSVAQGETVTFALELTTAAPLVTDDTFYEASIGVYVGAELIDEVSVWVLVRPEQRASGE